MAVTCTVVRNHEQLAGRGGSTEYCTATLSGTYTTGGFTFSPSTVRSTPGSSPQAGSTVLDVVFRSPSGYIYAPATTKTGFLNNTTVKIYSAPGTELANGTAVPDATVPVIIVKNRV